MYKRKVTIELDGKFLEQMDYITAEDRMSDQEFVMRAVECLIAYMLSVYEDSNGTIH